MGKDTKPNIFKKILYRVYLLICNIRLAAFDNFRSIVISAISCGSKGGKFVVLSGVFIEGYENLIIGNDVSINQDCFLSCYGGLTIGNHVSIGHRVSILSSEHQYRNLAIPIKYQPVSFDSVVIGNDVWIGANVTILSGVHLANGIVVGAGAVVTKSFTEEGVVIAGNPAKVIKNRRSH